MMQLKKNLIFKKKNLSKKLIVHMNNHLSSTFLVFVNYFFACKCFWNVRNIIYRS